MTAASIRVVYRSPADRLAARLGRALVRWADSRAVRVMVTHERRETIIENQRACVERERIALRMHDLRGWQ